MKPRLAILVCLLCHQALAQAPQIEVHFSPNGGCTAAIVKEIDAAKTTIRVQAYDFSSAPIAKALLEAHKRGVDVKVILDKKNRTAKYSSATFLANVGIAVLIDDKHKIAHSKVMVLDDQTIITGSFNFTRAAEESNLENLLVIRDKALAAKYTANWKAHADHSQAYQVKEKGYSETHREPIASGFVASAKSSVFHKADCKSAAKISAKNLVHYATRDEAIKAGKKPCAECQP